LRSRAYPNRALLSNATLPTFPPFRFRFRPRTPPQCSAASRVIHTSNSNTPFPASPSLPTRTVAAHMVFRSGHWWIDISLLSRVGKESSIGFFKSQGGAGTMFMHNAHIPHALVHTCTIARKIRAKCRIKSCYPPKQSVSAVYYTRCELMSNPLFHPSMSTEMHTIMSTQSMHSFTPDSDFIIHRSPGIQRSSAMTLR
jgi:hypothetical protein